MNEGSSKIVMLGNQPIESMGYNHVIQERTQSRQHVQPSATCAVRRPANQVNELVMSCDIMNNEQVMRCNMCNQVQRVR